MDEIGDVLRKFYFKYGIKNEGPPKGINVSSLLPDLSIDDELIRLRDILNNDESSTKFSVCKNQLNKIAELLSDGDKFLREIDQSAINYSSDSEFEHMVNGNFWYFVANKIEELPKEMTDEFDLGILQKQLLLVQGSLVFRLYMALVYMKEGPVFDILERAVQKNMKISEECLKLLRCDYVRHIRNALAHSSFEASIAGLFFSDRSGFKTISTPGFLNYLLTWIMVINTCCLTVISDHIQDK